MSGIGQPMTDDTPQIAVVRPTGQPPGRTVGQVLTVLPPAGVTPVMTAPDGTMPPGPQSAAGQAGPEDDSPEERERKANLVSGHLYDMPVLRGVWMNPLF